MTPPPPAPLSETWTEQDELNVQWWAANGPDDDDEPVPSDIQQHRFACHLLLQREEIERLTKHVERLRENARTVDWHGGLLRAEVIRLRSELSSLRETPTVPHQTECREAHDALLAKRHPDCAATMCGVNECNFMGLPCYTSRSSGDGSEEGKRDG